MKVNLEDLKTTQKKLDVYLPADVVSEKRTLIFNEFRKNAKVKGFRPGKAPEKVIESLYGKDIKGEVISKLISETFEDALTEVDLSPISKPQITPDVFEPEKEFHYSAVFDVLPKFEVSNYAALELKKNKVEVKQEDIDKALEQLRERSAQSKLLEEDRGVAKGDYAVVDFEGKLDGETVKDLKQENVRFVIGEGQLIQEFDDNILAMKRGEEKHFDVKYGDDFQIKEAAGRTVNYSLKVNEIYERILPDINDAFAKDIDYESLDDLKKKIEEDLKKQLESIEETKLKEQILEIFDKENDIEVPASLIQDEEDRLKRDFAMNFQRQGLPIPNIEGDSEAKFKERAERNVKSSIILSEIAKKEDIKVSRNELEKRLREISDSFQVPVDNIREIYQKNNMMASLEASIMEEKAIQFIKEKANIVEELENKINIDN